MTALTVTIILTLGISFFCSLLEAFILSITTADVEALKTAAPRRGQRLEIFKEDIEESTSAILTLNTVANTAGAALVGYIARGVTGDTGVLLIMAGLVVGILMFSEIIPKNIGVIYRRSLLPYLVLPLHVVRMSMYPISRLAMHSVRLVINREAAEKDEDQEQEIKLLAAKHAEDGSLTTSERDMIHNALTLDDVHVSQIMTPRTVVAALQSSNTVEEVFRERKHIFFGRLPVYEDNIDNIVGFVRRRDLLQARADDDHDKTVSELMGDPVFVPATATAADALQQFLRAHQQIAVVVDEFGSTTGVVTMEDIVEHILGREIYEDTDIAVDMRKLARERANRKPDTEPVRQSSGIAPVKTEKAG
jgi:CBS domain containing-hemolysin-like protein